MTTNEELKAAAERLRQVADAAAVLYVDGRFAEYNVLLERLYGADQSAVLGDMRTVSDAVLKGGE